MGKKTIWRWERHPCLNSRCWNCVYIYSLISIHCWKSEPDVNSEIDSKDSLSSQQGMCDQLLESLPSKEHRAVAFRGGLLWTINVYAVGKPDKILACFSFDIQCILGWVGLVGRVGGRGGDNTKPASCSATWSSLALDAALHDFHLNLTLRYMLDAMLRYMIFTWCYATLHDTAWGPKLEGTSEDVREKNMLADKGV